MSLVSAAFSVFSALAAAAGWVGHHVRSMSVAPQAWDCMECSVPNELDRDTCWSCGAGYGQDPLFPSRIPFERRWLCPECAVWNGIARSDCWRCGTVHENT
jgi:hypothetical protein